MGRRPRNERTRHWYAVRQQLLGARGDRETVARALGLHIRTIEKYEIGTPPDWYELALMGLAERWRQQRP